MTIEEKIKRLISMSPFHAVFVAQCVEDQSKEILSNPSIFLEEHKNDIVSPQIWIDCSKDAIANLSK